VPDTTLKIDSRPAYGSAMVLKTNAEKGSSGSGERSMLLSSLGSTPVFTPMSFGDGMQLLMVSMKISMPIFLVADPHSTGTKTLDRMPVLRAVLISSSLRVSPSRYRSMSSSSASATSSISVSLALST